MFSGPNPPLKDVELQAQARKWLTAKLQQTQAETGCFGAGTGRSEGPVQREVRYAVRSLTQSIPAHPEEGG